MARGWRGAFMSMFGDGEWRLEVVAVEALTPHYRRIRFHAPGFFDGDGTTPATFSAASWIRLWMPGLDDPSRESQRAYTVLDPDPAAERLTLDFVLHEPTGPGAAWAARAEVGDAIQATRYGIQRFTPPEPPATGYLLIGDASGLPGINGILAELPADVPVHVLLEEAHPDDRRIPVTEHPRRRITWVPATGPSALADAIEDDDRVEWFAWVAAEKTATKLLRARLAERGFPPESVKAQAYWVRGTAMGRNRGTAPKAGEGTSSSPGAGPWPEPATSRDGTPAAGDRPAPTDLRLPAQDGRVLRARRHGAGEPVVVLEAGLGNSALVWSRVVEDVAQETTTVLYDRAGFGGSDPAPAGDDRSFARLADDLNALLDGLGHGPFVLVGHSVGGPIVRLAAAARPERVAALVLADPAQEQTDGYYARWFQPSARAFYRVRLGLARAGLLRRLTLRGVRAKLGDAAPAYAAEEGRPSTVRAASREFEAFVPSLARLRDAPEPAHRVPVVLVSGGRTGLRHGAERPAVTAAHRAWVQAQPRGRFVVADCGHMVPLDAPGELGAAILEVVEEVRRPAS